ncbi:tetratricopeptide repeat protein [Aquabacter sp. L1I39]|uniref:tetratricopeptide repeat protein n=1 Tax=Aquabacter sp. L1I39 TaxID=2820278 RepID=UPI001ADA1C53|nr:tetratricopeptide repeat protein [Aquabacter sp. L1I39]QTL02884.1 tetratricopeptide repeat protein [Aquabacter sp. L1I39]
MRSSSASPHCPCRPVLGPFRRRLGRAGLAAALVLLAAPATLAQTTGPVPRPGVPEATAPRDGAAPRVRPQRDRRGQLDALFEALKIAPDDESAKAVGNRIDAIFAQSGSASADLLMARAELAAGAKEYDLAVELLNSVLTIAPDHLGALARRATIFYVQDDYADALSDISEVLAREPRHYTALFGLALIMRELGDDKAALAAARRALAINPHLEGAKDMVKELAVTVDGRDI